MNKKKIYEILKNHFELLGLKKKDNIIIHSDIASFGIFHSELPFAVFKILKKIIGAKGTLAVPLFNTSLNKKKIINLEKDFGKNENSYLSKYFFKNFKHTRTLSVFHSHLIHGYTEDVFMKNKNFNSFGKNSDFDLFKRLNFKLLLFGCDAAKGCTYLHHIEEKLNVKYRKKKTFTLKLQLKKKFFNKNLTYNVRKKNVKLDFNKIFFSKPIKKITKKDKLNFGTSYLVELRKFDLICTKILKKNINGLLK